MSVLLVAYDLHKEPNSDDYKGFMEVIKGYAWARLSESSYAIETNDSPQDIYNKLKPFTDDNDDVVVINLKKPYAGRHRKAVIDWLDPKLP